MNHSPSSAQSGLSDERINELALLNLGYDRAIRPLDFARAIEREVRAAPAQPCGEDAAEQSAAPMASVTQKRDDTGRLTSDYEPTPYEIKVAREAICREFGNNGTDGYYIRILKAIHGASPLPRPSEQADEADFKNFHRLLCERFGYVHDEADWKRDQLSLIEHIASKQTIDAGRYSRFRRWHPRLQTSYWTGQWWEPIYGEKMDACIDGLDEVPQPTPHADQSAARAKEPK